MKNVERNQANHGGVAWLIGDLIDFVRDAGTSSNQRQPSQGQQFSAVSLRRAGDVRGWLTLVKPIFGRRATGIMPGEFVCAKGLAFKKIQTPTPAR